MSAPAPALRPYRRIRRGRAWEYRIDNRRVPSVTTVLRALATPALVGWAARTAAEYTADNMELLQQVTRPELLDLVRGAPDRERNQRAGIGTDVHGFVQRYMAGEELEVPAELEGWIEQYLDFDARHQPQQAMTEVGVFSRTGQYGGTFDMFAELRNWGPTLVDVKTSGDVYSDYALQLAGYLGAEYLETGERVPWASGNRWPAVRCAVLWLRHDAWELMPIEVGRPEWAAFMGLRVATWWQETRSKMVLNGTVAQPKVSVPRTRLEVVK